MSKDDEDTLDHFVGEIVDDVLPEREKKIDDSVRAAFTKTFGDNWSSLPIKSMEGAIALMILDQILSPQGITPRVLAESALELSDKMQFDEKFKHFLTSVQEGSSITLEMVKSLGENVGGNLKDVFALIEAGTIVGADLAAKTLKKGAEGLKNFVDKFTKDSQE